MVTIARVDRQLHGQAPRSRDRLATWARNARRRHDAVPSQLHLLIRVAWGTAPRPRMRYERRACARYRLTRTPPRAASTTNDCKSIYDVSVVRTARSTFGQRARGQRDCRPRRGRPEEGASVGPRGGSLAGGAPPRTVSRLDNA